MKNKFKIPVTALVVVAIVIPFIIFLAVAKNDERGGLPIGERAPAISGITLSGDVVDVNALRRKGNWIVLNFFASWCTPCIKEHGELADIPAAASVPTQIISIQFNESESKGREFFEKYGGDWPVFVDSDVARTTALNYSILSVPETYLITPVGYIAGHWRGEITTETITERIDSVLEQRNQQQ